MKQYLDLLRTIIDTGVHRSSRGVVGGAPTTGTRSVFGHQMRFDLAAGFPLLTTKRVHMRSIIHELLWFIRGDTNVAYLRENKVTIWDEWADAEGELGPVYGAQWRRWGEQKRLMSGGAYEPPTEIVTKSGVDQLAALIDGLKKDPNGRRHILSAWNVTDIPLMALPPCHCFAQFYVADGRLSCMLVQRSGDIFLGIPFNMASYALLTHMIATVVGLDVGELVHVIGDAHLYDNHEAAALEQLTRAPGRLPRLVLDHRDRIDDFVFSDVHVVDYEPAAAIRADVVV